MSEAKIELEIDTLHIYGTWKYNCLKDINDKCQLCRKDLMFPSEDSIEKGLIKPMISVGECGHVYHTYCIEKYVKKSAKICPIDRTIWTSKTQIN